MSTVITGTLPPEPADGGSGGGGGGSVNSVTASGFLASSGGSNPNITFVGTPLLASNNLSELAATAATARSNLGLGSLATQSGTFSGISSGTNTGDQTITLTGAVTGTGTGTFATTLATQLTQTVLGNGSGSTAAPIGLTISAATGLVATGTTLTNTVLMGVAGGQTWLGGTASGDGVTVSTTSNATKGKFIVGSTATFYVDESQTATAWTTPILSVGTSGSGSGNPFAFTHNRNSISGMYLQNLSTGTGGAAAFSIVNSGGSGLTLYTLSSGYTTASLLIAGASVVEQSSNAQLLISNRSSDGQIIFAGAGRTEMGRWTTDKSFVVGLGLATSATGAFLYLNSMAGNPTGVPTSYNSGGNIATTIDRTNNRLNFYANSAWQGIPAASSTASGSQALVLTNGPAGIASTTTKWETYKDSAGVTSFRAYWQ